MDTIRLNSVLILFIIANIINMIFPKGMGYEEQTEFAYQLSKYIYGICILLMLPSLFSGKKCYFSKMKYMAFYIIIHILVARMCSFEFEFGNYLKTIMICLSFIFFEEMLTSKTLDKRFIYGYMISVFVNIAYLTLTQNRLEQALENAGHISGGQSLAVSMVYLLPLIFYLFKGRVATYLFLIGLIAVLVSLRRTAILAYIVCIPFIYHRIRGTISRKTIFFLLSGMAVIVYYVVTNYWFIFEDRFSDMMEESESGYYGSGRTGWWQVLLSNFFSSPFHWIQGFGCGRVAIDMEKAGFPFGSAHNDYIEIGYTYGLVGLYLWFGGILDVFKLYKKNSLKMHSALIMMASISYLFISIASGATEQPHFMCIALFATLMLKEYKIVKKEKRNEKLLFHYSSP